MCSTFWQVFSTSLLVSFCKQTVNVSASQVADSINPCLISIESECRRPFFNEQAYGEIKNHLEETREHFLPFPEGTAKPIWYGWDKCTHTGLGKYSWDFLFEDDDPVPIIATHDGVVLDIKKDSTENIPYCGSKSSASMAKIYATTNYVAVKWTDPNPNSRTGTYPYSRAC